MLNMKCLLIYEIWNRNDISNILIDIFFYKLCTYEISEIVSGYDAKPIEKLAIDWRFV